MTSIQDLYSTPRSGYDPETGEEGALRENDDQRRETEDPEAATAAFGRRLDDVFREAGIVTGAARPALLVHYRELLHWNRRHNLTRLVEPRAAAVGHFLDSAAGLPYIKDGEQALDVGSGAGFPGLVLAALRPAASFTLLEAREKRAVFLKQVVRLAGLANVEVVAGRWPLPPGWPRRYDAILTRAVFSDVDTLLTSDTIRQPGPGGRWILWRGAGDPVAAPPGFRARAAAYRLPGTGERALVIVEREGADG